MPEPRFRFADANDIAAIAGLVERAYRGPEAATGWTSEAAILTGPRSSTTEIDGLVADPAARFVLCEDGSRLVGCALIRRHGDGAYFGMFAIDPACQGRGLGKLVMTECERAAAALWQARYLRLTVISLRDTLIAWYERRGYVQTGEHEPFPFATATGALRTDFDLTVLQKPL